MTGAQLPSRFGGRTLVTPLTDMKRDDLLFLTDLIEAGKVPPLIDRRYPLAIPRGSATGLPGPALGLG
jgi:NADPH:quinone reductase-like Zn-dependent oxidoreductase